MYYLYILLCSDNTLYTGITNDVKKRMKAHIDGKGSKYVRSRSPFKLIYKEQYKDKSSACKRESEIKGWTRKEKILNLDLRLKNGKW
jgi:putative endonuclease